MLRSIARPSLAYDLIALADGGRIVIGRDSDSDLKLECDHIPFLLSRKHASLTFTDSQGGMSLIDCGSTNGTYTSRGGQTLTRLGSRQLWQLRASDTIGFGGPEMIVAGRETSVPNPFLFVYYPVEDELEAEEGGSQQSEQIPYLRDQPVSPTPHQDRQRPEMPPGSCAANSALLHPALQPHPPSASAPHLDAAPSCSSHQHTSPQAISPHLHTLRDCNNQTPTAAAAPPGRKSSGPRQVPTSAASVVTPPTGTTSSVAGDLRHLQIQGPQILVRHAMKDRSPLSGHQISSAAEAAAPALSPTVADEVSNQLSEILSNHMTCPVCHDWLLASHTLSCGHMFCGLCLATWLSHKHSCPSCRDVIAGMPVRCLQVDNTISDLANSIMSPATRKERKRKQLQWDDMSVLITQGWASSLQQNRLQQQSQTVTDNIPAAAPQPRISIDARPAPQESQRRQGPVAAGAASVRGISITQQLQQAMQHNLSAVSRQPFANVPNVRQGSSSGTR